MADIVNRKIWMRINRQDLDQCIVCAEDVRPRQHGIMCDSCHFWQHRTCGTASGNSSSISEIYCVDVYEGQCGAEIKDTILRTCGLCNVGNIVLKLRNHRGSLIPITVQLPQNSSSSPYILEVVNVHQNIKAQPRSVTIQGYDDTMREKLSEIIQRIDKLEGAVPQLKDKRNDKINNEMREVDQMLDFLQKRIQDAESVKWKGMFKKNPLW